MAFTMFKNVMKFSSVIRVHHRMYSENLRQKIFSVEINCGNDEIKQQFNSTFPDIVQDLTESMQHVPSVSNWYKRMLEYNVPNGKQRRGLCVLLSYKLLENPVKLTPDNMRLANILAWCSELIIGSMLLADDIIDQSEQRRGHTCWYKLEDIGISSVLDATILEDSAYVLLKKHLRHHPCYMAIVEHFYENNWRGYIGQSLDCRNTIAQTPNLDHISQDIYDTILQFKAEHISYVFPVCAAMYLAGIVDVSLHNQVVTFLRPIEILAQIKNDFLDSFGQENKTGKILCDDIRAGKCAWPAVVTLQRATPSQRAIMERCYGRSDEQSVQAVKDLYVALDMPTLYANFEEDILNKFYAELEHLDPRLPKQMFLNILEMS